MLEKLILAEVFKINTKSIKTPGYYLFRVVNNTCFEQAKCFVSSNMGNDNFPACCSVLKKNNMQMLLWAK